MNLILCGFKGCGKTHFGRLLAERVGTRFIDTDNLLEEKFHESCSALARRVGRETFLKHEAEVVATLQNVTSAIIALGGGTLLHPQSAQLISHLGRLIYLKEQKGSVKRRLLRPPLPSFIDAQDPDSSFEKMYEERLPLYEALSDVQLSLAGLDEEEILNSLSTFTPHPLSSLNNG